MSRAVIDLSQTTVIKTLLERSTDQGRRLATVESGQAQSAANAAAARDIAEDALLASQNPRTILSTQIVNGRLIITYSDGTTQDAGSIGGGVIPDTSNTLGSSTLKPAQINGATAPLIEIDARLSALGV